MRLKTGVHPVPNNSAAARLLKPDIHAGRVALITGGGTGIGRAMALDFGRTGARVAICGRRAEPLEQVRSQMANDGLQCIAIPADIREVSDVERVVDSTLAAYGRVDILVNNAGGQFSADAEQISLKGWRAIYRIVVDAAWEITRQVATKSMIPNHSGVVLFISFSP